VFQSRHNSRQSLLLQASFTDTLCYFSSTEYHYIGVCDTTLSWFTSYLSGRTQTFHVNGTSSDQLPVSCSIPQGSSAGPVEFIAYTEDVSEVFNCHGVQHHLYADDKQAYVDTPVSDVPTARAHYKAVSLMLVTGVPHVDYSLKLKQNSSGLLLRKFQKVS